MTKRSQRPDPVALESEVRLLRDCLLAAEVERAEDIALVHPDHRESATNLVHYVELRRHDLRRIQTDLTRLGLSSLGRSEADVLPTIDAVLTLLSALNGTAPTGAASGDSAAFGHGPRRLADNADRLLGPAPGRRCTRIMVTFPSEAASDADLVAELVDNGMDIARVNCAHDDAEAWSKMITLARSSTREGGPVKIAMDLGGPKLRTGPLLAGPRALRVAPRRDEYGRVVTAARVLLVDAPPSVDGPAASSGARVVPVTDADWLERRRAGEPLELVDSRGAKRRWDVIAVSEQGCLISSEQTTYLTPGLVISPSAPSGGAAEAGDAAVIGELPEIEQSHRVDLGDHVVLTRSLDPKTPTPAGTAHYIGCTLAEAFDGARIGERVWLDDGKIGGVIVRVSSHEIDLEITDVRPGGVNLKAGKGINLPDTDLRLDALTPKDLADLEFVARHADMVNLSFVRQGSDVEQLQRELERLGASSMGIVLKIENVAAFANLPELLLTALRSHNVGIMIARGDLAVEVGFERLAEVQEEILWACEAAHVPVIWATQVLDTLARTGQPSRAEVTDAAMAERAECVMLNKGQHIVHAMTTLDSILVRMQDHQDKKRSLLRRLRAWDRGSDSPEAD